MNFSRFYSTLLSFMFPSFPAESLLLPPKGPLYSLFFLCVCVCMCAHVSNSLREVVLNVQILVGAYTRTLVIISDYIIKKIVDWFFRKLQTCKMYCAFYHLWYFWSHGSGVNKDVPLISEHSVCYFQHFNKLCSSPLVALHFKKKKVSLIKVESGPSRFILRWTIR